MTIILITYMGRRLFCFLNLQSGNFKLYEVATELVRLNVVLCPRVCTDPKQF